MDLPGLPDEIDAVSHLRHESFGETKSPVAVFEIEQDSGGVAAGVGGVVPGTVVIGRPVDELELGIAAYGIDVEEIGQAEFPDAKFEAATRDFVEQREEAALVLDPIFAEGKNVMVHAASEIGGFAEQRVSNDVEISIAGQAESEREGRTTCLFQIEEEFVRVVGAVARVERQHP